MTRRSRRPFLRLIGLAVCVTLTGAVTDRQVTAEAAPAGSSPIAHQTAAGDADRPARVDAIFTSWIHDGEPGAAVLVVRDGEAIHRKGYGVANIETRAAITPETMFDIGSVSKQFTAMAIMILAERGRLRYDDPITRFFPGFQGPLRRVTVRHLLHHTSGLPDYMDLLARDWPPSIVFPAPARPEGWTVEPTARDVVDLLARQDRLRFPPGEDWEYSNSGYTLLGQIVAKASGVPCPRFMRDNIFRPLGMKSTLLYDETRPAIPGRATSYEAGEDGFRPVDYHPLNLIYGDGNVNTNIDDMAKWYDEIDRPTLIDAATLRRAFTSGELASGERTGYGFAWGVARVFGMERVEHTGSWVGFRALAMHYPGEHLTFVVLSNRSDFSRRDSALSYRLSRTYLGDKMTLPAPALLGAERLAAYEGRYRMGGETIQIAIDEGALMLTAKGHEPQRLLAESEERFYPEGLEGDRYVFERGGDGAVTGFRRREFLSGYGRGSDDYAAKVR